MRFYNNTGNGSVDIAIQMAEKFLSPDSKMIKEIILKRDFKYNSGVGAHVAEELLLPCQVMRVSFYKSKNPWSAAVGYSDGKNIFINVRRFSQFTNNDLIGLLLHEYSHACSGKFTHDNNYKTEDKCLYSVPYFMSENVAKWI